MKFDFIIGNPPYQDEVIGENKSFAPPIYHKFLENAYKIADSVEMIHPARFLFNAGSTPKEWNEKMLNDSHFKVINYYPRSSDVFLNTDIMGGIVITYHDNKKNFGAIKVFTPYHELDSILKKSAPNSIKKSLMNIVYVQNRFNLDNLYNDYPKLKTVIGSAGKDKRFRNNIFDKVNVFTEEKINKDDIQVYGIINLKRVCRYLQKRYFDFNHENIKYWKVLLPRSNGSGAIGEVVPTPLIGEPLIGKPLTGYTQTFIGIGAFKTLFEAEAALKYIKSKFARVMLGILKITQDNNRETWRMVPMQDFTSNSDIDWIKSIKEIDQQLYKKYGLDKNEIAFIESHVKEMK